MNELYEVKEFETIVGKKEYADQYKCIDESAFSDLIEFIHAYNADDEEADILDFIKIGYRRNVGETVTFQNYVGFIKMRNNYQIQILPKIDFADGEKDQTKEVFIRMLMTCPQNPTSLNVSCSPT